MVHKKINASGHHAGIISEGDLLHLHYQTYDPKDALELLNRILGEQPEDDRARMHEGREGHIVPLE